MQTLVITLVAAAVSGLAFIAYKHPKGYQRIFRGVLPISIMVPIAIIAANLGAAHVNIKRLAEEVAREPNQPIREVSYSIITLEQNQGTVIIALAVGAVVIGYLTFLYFLPKILIGDADGDKEEA